jgi:hypothetical protein
MLTPKQVVKLLEARNDLLLFAAWDSPGKKPLIHWKQDGRFLATVGVASQGIYSLTQELYPFLVGRHEEVVPGSKDLLTPDEPELATDLELRELATSVVKCVAVVGRNKDGVWSSFGGDLGTCYCLVNPRPRASD